jgi:hypothetical protein
MSTVTDLVLVSSTDIINTPEDNEAKDMSHQGLDLYITSPPTYFHTHPPFSLDYLRACRTVCLILNNLNTARHMRNDSEVAEQGSVVDPRPNVLWEPEPESGWYVLYIFWESMRWG